MLQIILKRNIKLRKKKKKEVLENYIQKKEYKENERIKIDDR